MQNTRVAKVTADQTDWSDALLALVVVVDVSGVVTIRIGPRVVSGSPVEMFGSSVVSDPSSIRC